MRRHAVTLVGALFALAIVFAAPARAPSPDNFIRDVSDRAFASLGENGLSDTERAQRFRDILHQAFDLPRIARFVLGRYWRVATEEQQREFTDLFEKFVVQAYSSRFRDLGGKKLLIRQARDLEDGNALVISEIEIANQPPVKINWRVQKADGSFQIVDVMVEGISMSVTQRDEFAAVIRQSGGKVEGLIDALRRKTSETN
ncbi:MAG: ABC transporter substrate-binding protein [Rhodospirillaceae bacterium]